MPANPTPEAREDDEGLVHVLQARADGHSTVWNDYALFREAAATIKRLKAERDAAVERLAHTQHELLEIDRCKATNFTDIAVLIIENRSVLRALSQSSDRGGSREER